MDSSQLIAIVGIVLGGVIGIPSAILSSIFLIEEWEKRKHRKKG